MAKNSFPNFLLSFLELQHSWALAGLGMSISYFCPVNPKLDTVLQMCPKVSQQCLVKGKKNFPWSAGSTATDTALYMLIVLAKRAHCWVFFTSRTFRYFAEHCIFSSCPLACCIGLIHLGHETLQLPLLKFMMLLLAHFWGPLNSSPTFQCIDAPSIFLKVCSTLSSMSHVKRYWH